MSDPSLSTPALDLGRAIKRVQNMNHRRLDTALAAVGLSLTQFDALRAIARHPRASSRGLATLVFMTDQSFGALANRLVAKGLVLRDADWGRTLAHSLTNAGVTALQAGTTIADQVLGSSFHNLEDSERLLLLNLLTRLL